VRMGNAGQKDIGRVEAGPGLDVVMRPAATSLKVVVEPGGRHGWAVPGYDRLGVSRRNTRELRERIYAPHGIVRSGDMISAYHGASCATMPSVSSVGSSGA
jgi:hypothetical protein